QSSLRTLKSDRLLAYDDRFQWLLTWLSDFCQRFNQWPGEQATLGAVVMGQGECRIISFILTEIIKTILLA
ncbi:hypothetical protein, partial [Endozoicomonas sp. YOMI1]|uniref:hypothetical protein n=1 Tax=Endozoicomonas sp. YOMI1 TaxID=2828739 RepID=UPI0021495495